MAGDSRPNVLLFFPDQWRYDCLSGLGHVTDTPYLDQLMAEGVTFTAAYSPCPSCIATRASLITGQTPNTCGRIGYQDGIPWPYRNTLMRLLRDGGYQTINVGKTHFWPQRANLGFEVNRLYDPQKLEDPAFVSDYHAWLDRETGGRIRDSVFEMSSNTWLANPWVHEERLHPNCWTADVAIEQLVCRDPTRPFFLQVGFHRPPPPIDPPLSWYERYRDRSLPPVPVGDWAAENDVPASDVGEGASRGRLSDHQLDRTRRAYYAQCSHLDFQIGRVLNYMRRLAKILENTWVIFTSDHGELLGDHHLFRKCNGIEGSAKVPLIVRPPRRFAGPRGVRCDAPVAHQDLLPTVLEAAGVELPPRVEGRSLLPLAAGQNVPWRQFVHGEHSDRGWQFVTDGREKYVWNFMTGQELFFDLTCDPRELRNLVADAACAERVAVWRKRLIDVLAQRPEDGLSDGQRLIRRAEHLPPYRQWIQEGRDPTV